MLISLDLLNFVQHDQLAELEWLSNYIWVLHRGPSEAEAHVRRVLLPGSERATGSRTWPLRPQLQLPPRRSLVSFFRRRWSPPRPVATAPTSSCSPGPPASGLAVIPGVHGHLPGGVWRPSLVVPRQDVVQRV